MQTQIVLAILAATLVITTLANVEAMNRSDRQTLIDSIRSGIVHHGGATPGTSGTPGEDGTDGGAATATTPGINGTDGGDGLDGIDG